jgi:hypothetical protein
MAQLAILLLFFSTGCAALVVGGAAGVGTYSYVAGQLKHTYAANLDRAYRATESACKSLQLPITKSEKKLSSGAVHCKDGDTDVWISLKSLDKTPKHTEISVRVGVLGDEAASRRIHEAIRARL